MSKGDTRLVSFEPAQPGSGQESKAGWRNITSLGIVSFFTDTSTEMILGLLPAFILMELGGSRGLLGLIEGAGEAAGSIIRMPAGLLSDRRGKRKPFVLLGYGISTFAKPLFALVTAWPQALGVRFADRLGKGVRTAPRDALISDSIVEKQAGRAFGLHRSLDQLGSIVGPILAFALVPMLGTRGLFLLSFVPGAVALLILLAAVREVPRPATVRPRISNIRAVLRGRFALLLGVMTVFSLGAFNYSFVLVRAAADGVPTAAVPLVLMVINAAHTALGVPAGVAGDRIGRERVLMVGYGLFAVTAVLMMTSRGDWLGLVVLAAIYGAYVGIEQTIPRALIPRYAPPEFRGTAYGLYFLVTGLGLFVANAVVGSLWDLAGVTAAFTYSLLTTVAAIAALLFLDFRR